MSPTSLKVWSRSVKPRRTGTNRKLCLFAGNTTKDTWTSTMSPFAKASPVTVSYLFSMRWDFDISLSVYRRKLTFYLYRPVASCIVPRHHQWYAQDWVDWPTKWPYCKDPRFVPAPSHLPCSPHIGEWSIDCAHVLFLLRYPLWSMESMDQGYREVGIRLHSFGSLECWQYCF